MRSLRFRLPALFLAGFVGAGVVGAIAAVRLFQDHAREQTLGELRRQAAGLAELYTTQALETVDEGRRPPRFAPPLLERSTGTRLYYAGVAIFPGEISGLRQLDRRVLDWERLSEGRVQTLEFEPPGVNRSYLAVAHPLRLGGETIGALVVAKPQAALQERWVHLFERFALAFLAGIAVAAGLVWYLSRRLTEPVLALSRAADRVAQGRYDTEVPAPGSRDEIGHLAERFREMTQRLAEAEERERNFLIRISHELRTPLTAIRGHVEALREGLAEDPEARDESLAVIQAESDRLARLVGDVLDLARLDSDRFTLERDEVELTRLLEHAYQSRSEEARRRGIEYERSFEADPVLHTDGDRVLQIVSNLLDNAFTWTPDGGRIELGLTAEDGRVAVSVADSGPGVPEAERERIFRPFFSTDRAGGVGLGLAVARELAHALGGDVELEPRQPNGSLFRLHLPAR